MGITCDASNHSPYIFWEEHFLKEEREEYGGSDSEMPSEGNLFQIACILW